MDDHVLRGMAKWPNVPAVYGWLALERRGQWLIKGEPVTNPVVTEFIGRNYEADEQGRWFFQNGPQRVFVTLDYTPCVYRAINGSDSPLEIVAHTGAHVAALRGAWIDEAGAVLVQGDAAVGVVDDRSLEAIVASFVDAKRKPVMDSALDAMMERLQRGERADLWLEHGGARVEVEPIESADVPRRFGFDPNPLPPAGHPECN